MTVRIGLIVNPIAGMGGRVGLKGTDGDALMRAMAKGAVPLAGTRAAACIAEIASRPEPSDAFALYTGPGAMGEQSAREAGMSPIVLPSATASERTTADDTAALASAMAEHSVDLLLFAGGDGTARDIYRAVGERVLTLGIPAGVKIHSAVFASSPRQAGMLVSDFIRASQQRTASYPEKTAEVMDIDEDAYRSGTLKARLFGYLRIPYARGRVQNLKSGSPASDAAAQEAIGHGAAEIVEATPDTLFLIGAGTTTRALLAALGTPGTLLGVDAWCNGKSVANDIGEREILELLDRHPHAKIVVTPIGGQGFIFGRGNQQFSPAVIRRVGKENIMLLAAPAKLHALGTAPLLTDTGDDVLDRELEGYYRIVSGYGQYSMHKVERG